MEKAKTSVDEYGKDIVQGLYKEGMILTWRRDKPAGWTLASSIWSPFYINLRLISSASPELYRKVGEAFGPMLKEAGFVPDGKHKVVGIAMAGIPFANAVTLLHGIPSCYTRKLPSDEIKTPQDMDAYIAKDHGQHALVEGDISDGDTLALIDDLVTKFDSKLLAKAQIVRELERRNIKDVSATHVFVLFDREQGAAQRAAEVGMELHALIPFASKGLSWLKDVLSDEEYSVIADYLKDPRKYQDPAVQERLKASALKR